MSDSTRVAFVSGAAQGIGQKIALRLADDGLDVAVNDIPSRKAELEELVSQIKAKGRRAIAVPGDVSVEEDVRNAVDKVVADLGGLDVVSLVVWAATKQYWSHHALRWWRTPASCWYSPSLTVGSVCHLMLYTLKTCHHSQC